MKRTAAIATAALLVGLSSPPAAGATEKFGDPRRDGAGASGVRQVVVDYGRNRLEVRVRVRDVSRQGGLAVYVDSRPQKPGPELVLLGPISLGDYDWKVLRITRGWKPTTHELLCGSDLRSRRATDTARVVIETGCLRNPDTFDLRTGKVDERQQWRAPAQVRVSVKTTGGRSRDWSPAAKKLHPAVGRA